MRKGCLSAAAVIAERRVLGRLADASMRAGWAKRAGRAGEINGLFEHPCRLKAKLIMTYSPDIARAHGQIHVPPWSEERASHRTGRAGSQNTERRAHRFRWEEGALGGHSP